jgi:hypothetical protein
VLSLITPENLPATLTAIGVIITAIGGVTLYRVQKEPPKPGTADAVALALAENTRATLAMAEAMKDQNHHFADNNRMFGNITVAADGMAKDQSKILSEIQRLRENSDMIRDAANRLKR